MKKDVDSSIGRLLSHASNMVETVKVSYSIHRSDFYDKLLAYSSTVDIFGPRAETLPAELNYQNNLQFLP